jgi:hypothetical protein
VILVVGAVLKGGNSAHHLILVERYKERRVGMLVERVLLGVEHRAHVAPYWGHPLRVIRVEPIRKLDESVDLTPVVYINLCDV